MNVGFLKGHKPCPNCGSTLIVSRFRFPHCFVCEWNVRPEPRFYGWVGKLLWKINHELPERGSSATPSVMIVDGYCYVPGDFHGGFVEDTEATRSVRGIGRR